MKIIYLTLQVLDAGLAIAAAVYWYRSSKVSTPSQFSIHVIKPEMAPLGQPLGGKYVGHGFSQDLQQLGDALNEQSRLSKTAAIFAALTALLQGLLVFIPTG
jgi:hypothetical protein